MIRHTNVPQPLDYVFYVAKNGNDRTGDGSIERPYLTINHANNTMIADKPPYPVRGVILVKPGIYEEMIEAAYYRIYIIGDTRNPGEKDQSVTIYNTGEDSDHYCFANGMTGRLNLIGIQLTTPTGKVFGKLEQSHSFAYCKFKWGHFIESAVTHNTFVDFHNCIFMGDSFNLTGTTPGTTSVCLLAFSLCDFCSGTMKFESDGGKSKNVKFHHCKIGNATTFKGDWGILSQWSELYSNGKYTFDTNGEVDIFSTIIVNGIHFTSDTAEDKKIVNCLFRDTPTGVGDVTADVDVAFLEYTGNHQDNGVDGEVLTASKIKNVAGGQNTYRDIHEALQGSKQHDSIINLCGDVTVTTALVIPPNRDIQIDGNKKWSLTSTAASDLVILGANQTLSFINMKQIIGGKKAKVGGAGATLSLISCGRYTEPCYLNIETEGASSVSYVYLVKSTVIGTSAPPLLIKCASCEQTLDRAFLKGAATHPAVEWTVDAQDKFRAKFTTLIHGDGAANSPLDGAAAFNLDIRMYACGLNANFPPADFTNKIVSANNTVDAEITF